jgi:hypothetical protein
MKRYIALALLPLLALASLAYSQAAASPSASPSEEPQAPSSSGTFNWPSTQAGIAAGFAGNLNDGFCPGLVLSGEGLNALAIQSGEVVYSREENGDSEAFPSTLGSFVAVEHRGNAAGYLSVYAHLAPGSIAPAKSLAQGDIVGVFGASGCSPAANCLFMVFDRDETQFVNPMALLPSRSGGEGPGARDLVLLDDSGKLQSLSDGKGLIQGQYELYAQVSVPSSSAWKVSDLTPSLVVVTLNGKEAFRLAYDSLKANQDSGRRLVDYPNGHEYRSFYDADGRTYLGTLTLYRGKNVIGVGMADNSGAKRSVSYSLSAY